MKKKKKKLKKKQKKKRHSKELKLLIGNRILYKDYFLLKSINSHSKNRRKEGQYT